jgi:hypothetical protein
MKTRKKTCTFVLLWEAGLVKHAGYPKRPAKVHVFGPILAEISKRPAKVHVNLAISSIFCYFRKKTCRFVRLSGDLPNIRKKTCTFVLLWEAGLAKHAGNLQKTIYISSLCIHRIW